MSEKLEKKSPEYLDGFFDGIQHMREIFDKATSDADKLNYDKGRHDTLTEIKIEVERLKNKKLAAPTPTETHKCYQGGRILGYDDVLAFIDNLIK